jgi:hypothetical protein
MSKYIVSIVIAAVLGAVVAVGVLYGLSRDKGGKTDVILAIDDIKEIAQLATVEYHISTFLDRKKQRQWYEWLDARFIVFLKGVIKGSVDLNLAEVQLPAAGTKTVSIRFKKGAVIVSNPEIGRDDIRFITVSDPNVINRISDEDRNRAQGDAIAALKKAATDAGIVEKTAREAQILLTKFLGGLGYTAKIEFEGIQLK